MKNRSISSFLLAFFGSLSMILSVPRYSHAENFQFRHIGEKDGLGYTWINHINGDSRGYVWFSTMYGAFRYDGSSFREYRFTSGEGKLLRVNVILEDSSSMLWFGTEGGLFRHNPVSGEETHYFSSAESPYRLSSDYVGDICEDGDGNIWVASPSGVDRIGRDGTMKSWKIGNVRTLMVDSHMNVWAGADRHPMVFDDASGDFVPASLPVSGLGIVTDLFQDSRDDIWISTVSGLVRYSPSRDDVKLYNVASGTLPNDLVRQTVEDRDGNVWAATEHGLVRFSDGVPEFVLADEGNLWGLNDNAIYSLYCDRDDNLWVGTFFGGVNVKYSCCRMFSFLLTCSAEFSASSRVVSSIMYSEDELIVGTENDGVHIFGSDGSHRHFKAGERGLSTGNIHAVCRDSRGNLWLGSYLGGLFLLNSGGSSFRNFKVGSPGAGELSSNNIYSILEDSCGSIWFGTRHGGLYRYDYGTGTLRHASDGLPRNLSVWDICEDSAGDIWLACYGGRIWKLSSSENYAPAEVDSPVSTYVSVSELSDGRIAFCTETDGVVCVNPSTLASEKVTAGLELQDNTVYALLQDDNGKVWFSTNFGLCRTDLTFGSVDIFTINDGLLTNRFNYNSSEKHDGKLYFGSTNGLVIVDPSLEEVPSGRRMLFNDQNMNNASQRAGGVGPAGMAILLLAFVVLLLLLMLFLSSAKHRHELEAERINGEKSRKVEIDLGSIDVPTDNSDEQLIRKISSVILENISNTEFDVESLCLQTGMSKASLYRKLKAITGESTNEFIQNFRLKYAARLLSDTDRPVSDIAYDVGFSDPYYFSRAFKKLFGLSPKQWRQRQENDSAKN